MDQEQRNSPFTLQRLAERLRDADNFTYQDACIAADIVDLYLDIREVLKFIQADSMLTIEEARQIATEALNRT